MNRHLLGAACWAVCVAAGGTAEAAGPFYAPFGIDMSGTDRAVKPQDDFYTYVNGGWMARTQIPADQPSIDTFYEIINRTDERLKGLLEQAAADAPAHPTTVAGKVGAMYAAFMDEKRIEALGHKPIDPDLNAIRAATDKAAIARIMGQSVWGLGGAFFGATIDIDVKNPSQYAVLLNQAGLGLPNRDYYLNPEFAKQKAAYGDYIRAMLTLINWPDAEKAAPAILAMESRIAQASWPLSQERDEVALYNPETIPGLEKLAPGFAWQAFLDGAKLSGKPRVIVGEKTAFPKIAGIFADTNMDTLKAWLAFNVADITSGYLSSPFQQARFDFRDKILTGQKEMQPRWKRGVSIVAATHCVNPGDCTGSLTWAVGQLYTAKYFTPATRTKAQALTRELLVAFHHRIENLTWMGNSTKTEALKKLDTYTVKVGYPDHLRDYSHVEISRDDLVGDVRAAAAADWAFHVDRSSGPVDKSDWGIAPQIVNAYNGSLRDIVFPAAILQPPFFDPAADDAVNYGSIGAIIGHEMTHGFDDSGRELDAAGALRDWWTKQDAAAFKARAALLGAEYAAFEPVPGMHINAEQTMGENIADLGGVVTALDAYHASLHGKPAPVLGGLTGDQRFFMAWAQGWRIKASEEAIKESVASDFHSYDKFRAIGPLQNVDAWYSAFDVKPGDRMYRDPKVRAHIW
jgi:putative endopeptidase